MAKQKKHGTRAREAFSGTREAFSTTRDAFERSGDRDDRKASVALYVMLDAEEKERYEALAHSLGMTMRDFVRNALSDFEQKMSPERNAIVHGLAPTHPNVVSEHGSSSLHVRVADQGSRLSAIEQRFAMFIGGVLGNLVLELAYDLAGRDMGEEEWKLKRRAYLDVAFDMVLRPFPQPLRDQIAETKKEFLDRAIASPETIARPQLDI